MRLHLRLLLAIFLVAMPIVFTWHAELLATQCLIRFPIPFTNGLVSFDGMLAYHINMYLMFIIVAIAAFVLMRDDELLSTKGVKR